MTRQRLTVQDASEVLGVSVDAVRMRVRRGSLEAEKDPDGRVYVRLDIDEDNVKSERQAESSELVEALRDQISMLRKDVEDWKEEARRKDTIIMSMTHRIPELELASSPEQREAPETDAAEPERVDDTGPETTGTQTSSQRSWWRRMFGG